MSVEADDSRMSPTEQEGRAAAADNEPRRWWEHNSAADGGGRNTTVLKLGRLSDGFRGMKSR